MIMALLIVYDIVAAVLTGFLALLIRFDLRFSAIPEMYLEPWKQFAPIYVIICLVVFSLMHLYKSIWRFASYTELMRIIMAMMITSVLHAFGITVMYQRMPITYYVIGAGIQFIMVVGIRFSYRFVLLMRAERTKRLADHVMLIGAGAAGQLILRELRQANEIKENVVCIIDDNKNKWGRDIEGVPVVGGRDKIKESVEKYDVDKIYLAIPSVAAKERKAMEFIV